MPPVVYKPIEKVKKAPPIILQSFNEVLREEGVFKAFEGDRTGTGYGNVYTVPVGKIFYLISAMLEYRTDHANPPSSGYGVLLINSMPILRLNPPDLISIEGVTSVSPRIPVKLYPGETIKVYSGDAKVFVQGVVSGYEIKADRRLKFMK